MTYGPTGENLTEEVWTKKRIGIWFGAWRSSDLAKIDGLSSKEAAKKLTALPAQKKLGPVSGKHVDVIRRFQNLSCADWVFSYFSQAIHLGQVASSTLIVDDDAFARKGEPFKTRKLKNLKSFELDRLPESFRLLSSAGRGTLHQLGATRILMDMLVRSSTVEDAVREYQGLGWEEWLEALGPKGWETLCLAYLIYEKNFVPTGVGIGGTLADFDIVGRDRNGRRILAQCKKSPGPHRVDDNERKAYRQSKNADVYLFAYNDALGAPDNVLTITGAKIGEWFRSSNAGRSYLKLIRSK
jgi:hypothetical protein